MSKFLRPETLFGRKFEGYLNERNVRGGEKVAAGGFRSAESLLGDAG